jgi:RHS repeat-associated protein
VNSVGVIAGTYAYDTYGQITAHTGSASTPLQYTGQYTDSETGFVYLRARYYDPATAQFVTVDPALAQTGSAYGYVGDNPVNLVDPLGLSWYNPLSWGRDTVATVVGGTVSVGFTVACSASTYGVGTTVCIGLSGLVGEETNQLISGRLNYASLAVSAIPARGVLGIALQTTASILDTPPATACSM